EPIAHERAEPLLPHDAEHAAGAGLGDLVLEVDRDDLPGLDPQQRARLRLVLVHHELLAQPEERVLDVHDELAVAGPHAEHALEERPELALDDVVPLRGERDTGDLAHELGGHGGSIPRGAAPRNGWVPTTCAAAPAIRAPGCRISARTACASLEDSHARPISSLPR